MLKKLETRNSLKTLKFRNRKLVLQFMRNAGAVSVNEISCATGLSKMTVHKIIDHYLNEGMIANAGKGVSTEEGGKKPNLFVFNADCRFIFTVRLAGECLATSIVNLKGEVIVRSQSAPLGDATFDQVVAMVGEAFAGQIAAKGLPRENCLAAVVGVNGIVDVDKGVCLTSYQYPAWGNNIQVRDRLREILPGDFPVHVDSWWRHLAHGELHCGCQDGSRNFFLIGNSGDSISGGMVVDGQVCGGVTGFAGEIGHMVVAPHRDEVCVCGGRGCLEAMTAPRRVVKLAGSLRDRNPDSLLFHDAGGTPLSLTAVGAAADAGDPLARSLLDEAAGHFAVAVNNIIQVCDPGRIVFFGEYARAGEYFLAMLRSAIETLSLCGLDKRTSIDTSNLDEECGVVGAAAHMTDRLFSGAQ